ncbi:hypothetical protein C8J56DRAFT_1051206 [Mycena floridula]|nr:hypothetical protein C8J56DRAFT_1051206 [Mycena floridula]
MIPVSFHFLVTLLAVDDMETPPTTPQRQRNVERQNERNNRVMSTPQHRRLPQPVPDIDFAPWGLRGEDPFMDVDANGQALRLSQGIGDLNLQDRYPHLPPELRAQLASVAAHPTPRGRGRGCAATVNNAQAGSSGGHSHGTVSNAEPGPSRSPPPALENGPDGGFEPPQQDDDFDGPPERNLPPAFQPVNNENDPLFEAINLGRMNIECSKCHALHWLCERLKSSSDRNPHFGTCCLDGKVLLPPLEAPPQELKELFEDVDNPDAKHFWENIRQYNAAFAFTSLGVKTDRSVMDVGGPPIFKIQGALYHQLGQLLPGEDPHGQALPAKYAQIYFFDTNEQLDVRDQNNQIRHQLKCNVINIIQDVLH